MYDYNAAGSRFLMEKSLKLYHPQYPAKPMIRIG